MNGRRSSEVSPPASQLARSPGSWAGPPPASPGRSPATAAEPTIGRNVPRPGQNGDPVVPSQPSSLVAPSGGRSSSKTGPALVAAADHWLVAPDLSARWSHVDLAG